MRPEGEQGAGSDPSGSPDAAAAAAVEALRRGVRPEENARLLHDLYHPRLRAYFARRVRSPHDVADLTQETFIKIYSHIEAYRGDSRFSAWVFAIARNVLLRWRARRPPEEAAGDGPSAGTEPAAAEPDPEALAGERERQALQVRVPGRPGLPNDAAVRLNWEPGATHFFDKASGLRRDDVKPMQAS